MTLESLLSIITALLPLVAVILVAVILVALFGADVIELACDAVSELRKRLHRSEF